jgi:HAD superfamily hydrolase (TIGR01509 family)
VASLRANGIALRPGVARLMQEARDAGVKLAIATTTDPANLTPLLRSVFAPAGEAMFSAIVSGDEVAAKKPAPDVFQLALTRLGLPASSCIAFEDSANGVTSARRAGLAVVATPSAFTPDDDLSLGVSVVSDMGEPGRPHRHVAGWMWPGGVVTLESLRVLLAKVHG